MNSTLVEVRVAPALADIVTQLQALHETVEALPDLKTFERTVHEALKSIDRLAMETLLVEKIKTGGAAALFPIWMSRRRPPSCTPPKPDCRTSN